MVHTRSTHLRQPRNCLAWNELDLDLLVAIASACETVPALGAFTQTCREWRIAVVSANTNILWGPTLSAQYPRALEIERVLSLPEGYKTCYKQAFEVQQAVASEPVYNRATPSTCVLSDFTFTCELVKEGAADGERPSVATSWTGKLDGSSKAIALPGEGASFTVPLDWARWKRSWISTHLSKMRLCVSISRIVDGERRSLLCFRSDTMPDDEVDLNVWELEGPLLHPRVFAAEEPFHLPRMVLVLDANDGDENAYRPNYRSMEFHFELLYVQSHIGPMRGDEVRRERHVTRTTHRPHFFHRFAAAALPRQPPMGWTGRGAITSRRAQPAPSRAHLPRHRLRRHLRASRVQG